MNIMVKSVNPSKITFPFRITGPINGRVNLFFAGCICPSNSWAMVRVQQEIEVQPDFWEGKLDYSSLEAKFKTHFRGDFF